MPDAAEHRQPRGIASLLLGDPGRTDYAVAMASGASQRLAKTVRAELEAEGLIPAALPAAHASPQARPPVRPYSPTLPRQPNLSAGKCSSPKAKPGWWTSRDQREREAAIWACRSCPVLAACREWSLSLPVTDASVYGGVTANERARARRERAATAVATMGPQRSGGP